LRVVDGIAPVSDLRQMPSFDRTDVLRALEQRHELLAQELDALHERVESALVAYGLQPREESSAAASAGFARLANATG
jgi:hypothetical protein